MSEQKKVEKVEVDGDNVKITIVVSKDDYLKEGYEFYDLRRQVTDAIKPIIIQEILDNHKKEIVDQCLKEVNWPEIVRSEIAVRVIKAAASSY